MRKSMAIIGEGETEWFYFDSLRVACRYPFRLAPDFPAHSDIDHLLKLSKAKKNEGYDYVVCLLDMDRLNAVPAEMRKYKTFRYRKENKDIMFIETNPCTEFWFLLHFLPTLQVKHYMSYEQLLPELQKYMPGYEKTKKYFVRTKLYEFLVKHGNLDQAMKNGETLSILASAHPEDKIAYSQVARVLKLLEQMKEDVR
jgi:hypothetical protein